MTKKGKRSCVFVCEKKREGGREGAIERDKGREIRTREDTRAGAREHEKVQFHVTSNLLRWLAHWSP